MNTPVNLDDLVLDAPAAVGAVRFGKGVKWSTVIAAAQRHHEYVTQPEQERKRIARATRNLATVREWCERPTSDPGEPA